MGLKTYFGTHEHAAVGIICFVILLIGAVLILSSMKPFGTAYENIEVTYTEQGENILIHETFLTRISASDSFNVLFRSFGETICLSTTGSQAGTNSNCNILIQDISCSKGTPYFSEYNADPINMLTRQSFKPANANKIQSREVGCYSDRVFTNEKTTMTVTYIVSKKHVALNMNKHVLFSQDHFAINNLQVQAVQESTSKSYLPKDGAVNILVTTGAIETNKIAYNIQALVWILLALAPFLIWNLFGKEKSFMVPEYLHVLPNKTTSPWQVDLFLNGKNELSKNGMASILMELYAANILVVETVKKTFSKTYEFHITPSAATNTISAKAKKFLEHLLEHEERKEGKKIVCVLPKNASITEQSFMQQFFKSGDVRQFVDATFDKKGSGFMIAYVVIFILISLVLGYIGPDYLYPFIIGLVVLVSIVPKSLFARFKGDKYKEYLEWQAFKNMLEDYAKIKQYLKEDQHMWKEWLTYATAMGSAEKLLKSMKELNILSPAEYERTHSMYTHLIAYSLISNAAANPKSSGGAGGIGGGGGFGGGGGGGR